MDLSVWQMKSQLMTLSPSSRFSLSSWRATLFCLMISTRSWDANQTHWPKTLMSSRICDYLFFFFFKASLWLKYSNWNCRFWSRFSNSWLQMWPLTLQVSMLLCSSARLLGVWAESNQRLWSVIQRLICCSRASCSPLLLSSCSTSWTCAVQTIAAGKICFLWGSRAPSELSNIGRRIYNSIRRVSAPCTEGCSDRWLDSRLPLCHPPLSSPTILSALLLNNKGQNKNICIGE